jgi:hypothetical protein
MVLEQADRPVLNRRLHGALTAPSPSRHSAARDSPSVGAVAGAVAVAIDEEEAAVPDDREFWILVGSLGGTWQI